MTLRLVARGVGVLSLLGLVSARGPPDWFDACKSTDHSELKHCCNDTHLSGCNLRIRRKPTGTSHNDTHAARFAVDQPWTISYEFTVPQMPTIFSPASAIYYIWGDTDFDSYGFAPRAAWPMSKYIYNQIVPQLVLGNALASNDEHYAPGWTVFRQWAVQAQYYWSSCTKPDGRRCADGYSQSFAQCGEALNVSAGVVLQTHIVYNPDDGAISASIGAEGAAVRSVVHLSRPFPNEDPPLWNSWRDFFEAAQAKSEPVVGPGVLNHPDFNIETHQVSPSVMCEVCPFQIAQDSVDGELGGPLVWVNNNEFNGTTAADIACAQACLGTPRTKEVISFM